MGRDGWGDGGQWQRSVSNTVSLRKPALLLHSLREEGPHGGAPGRVRVVRCRAHVQVVVVVRTAVGPEPHPAQLQLRSSLHAWRRGAAGRFLASRTSSANQVLASSSTLKNTQAAGSGGPPGHLMLQQVGALL